MVGNLPEVTSDYWNSTSDGVIFLDLQKTNNIQVQDQWKMTPWNLLTNEGSNLDPVDISLHNYYNSSIAYFGQYSGFTSREDYIRPNENGDNFPYWNPIIGTNFKDPATRDSVISINFETFYLDFPQIIVPYIYDDGENNPVLDEDNFMFGNTIHPKYGPGTGSVDSSNGAPGKLLSKGRSRDYYPFTYEPKYSYVLFRTVNPHYQFRLGSATEIVGNELVAYPLLMGGAGFSPKAPHHVAVDTTTYQKTHISNLTTSGFYGEGSDDFLATGFRCIFPLDDSQE